MIKEIIGRFMKVSLAAAGVFLMGGASADVYTWTGNGTSNYWTDKGNWSPEPASTPTDVVFPAGQDWTVTCTWTVSYNSIELPDGSGTVTFVNPAPNKGGVVSSAGSITIGAGREIKVDGIELQVRDCYTTGSSDGTLRLTSGAISPGTTSPSFFGGNVNVIVEDGTFGLENSTLNFTNNATLTVHEGLAQAQKWLFWSPDPPRESITRVRLLGGTFRNTYKYSYTTRLYAGAHLENVAGTLIWGDGSDFWGNRLSSDTGTYGHGASFGDYVSTVRGTLIIPSSLTMSNYKGTLNFELPGDYYVGGEIYLTNNTANAGIISLYATNTVLRGGATIYANGVAARADSNVRSENDLYLTRLNLGNYGIRRTGSGNNFGLPVRFRDGIVFGVWGDDVSMQLVPSGYNTYRIEPYGPVVYDTQDCFEPETTRTINMSSVRLDGATELTARGGGAAVLAAATGSGELRTLEVAAGTTLEFTNDTMQTALAGLKAMNLKLGEDATLKIDLSLGDYVDASAVAEFGAGAKIVVTALPATLTAGQLYPIYFAPAGTDPDLSTIEYALGEWPTGWSLAKTGNAVYLTDGNAPAYSSSRTKGSWERSWSGAGSDGYYATPENWVSNDVANTMNHLAYFQGRLNTDISIASSLSAATFSFGTDSGPFMFCGEPIQFSYPAQWPNIEKYPSVVTLGKFPVVISNCVSGVNALRLTSYREGSIALVNGGGADASGAWLPLAFGGDIRLGGSWSSAYVRVMARSTAASNAAVANRNSRLTVLPGATFTVESQTGDVNEYGVGAFAIATNATATIGGTDLTFTSNNTHYVDGALTVNCPLVPTGRQVFRGDGTLTLAGGVSAAAGGVRVEGNLTLVPASWVNDVELSAKDNVTIAPTGDWSFGGGATLDIEDHSTLTLATGGHKVTLACPVASEGSLTVTGTGPLVLKAGLTLGRLTCPDGAKLTLAGPLETGRYVDVLAVRDDDASIAFAEGCKVKSRLDEATGRTVYSVRKNRALVLIVR